jgi:hypothetical protein
MNYNIIIITLVEITANDLNLLLLTVLQSNYTVYAILC